MSNQEFSPAVRAAVRDGATRAIGAIGMMGIGLIHLLDIHGKLTATPYMFWMYVGLIVGSIAVAFELVRTGDRRAWFAGTLLAAGAVGGFLLSRTVGLPQSMDDIGNWSEPLGIASLFVEGSLIALSAYVIGAVRAAPARANSRRGGLALAA